MDTIQVFVTLLPGILLLVFFLGFKAGENRKKTKRKECGHQWRVISVENMEYAMTAPIGEETVVQTKVHCTCKECFETKTFLSNGTLDKIQAREIYQFRN